MRDAEVEGRRVTHRGEEDMICDHAKTCGDCWTTQAMDRVRERAEKAEARVAELEAALGTLEHLGADGVSVDGCAWCLIGGMGDAYTVRMIEAEQHVAACPIGRALRRTGPSVGDTKETS